jgi:hypothetical protein
VVKSEVRESHCCRESRWLSKGKVSVERSFETPISGSLTSRTMRGWAWWSGRAQKKVEDWTHLRKDSSDGCQATSNNACEAKRGGNASRIGEDRERESITLMLLAFTLPHPSAF